MKQDTIKEGVRNGASGVIVILAIYYSFTYIGKAMNYMAGKEAVIHPFFTGVAFTLVGLLCGTFVLFIGAKIRAHFNTE